MVWIIPSNHLWAYVHGLKMVFRHVIEHRIIEGRR
jgi:hypothetical protein